MPLKTGLRQANSNDRVQKDLPRRCRTSPTGSNTLEATRRPSRGWGRGYSVTAQCPQISRTPRKGGGCETGGTDTQTDMVPNKRDRHMRSKI
jgi:hypothetical protein